MTHDELVQALLGAYPGVGWSYEGDGSTLEPHAIVNDAGETVCEARGLTWPETAGGPPIYEDLESALAQKVAAAEEDAWAALRMKRDRWLAQTDAFFVDPLPADFPSDKAAVIDAHRDEWAAFRQALRDLPSTSSDPAAVVWPAPPIAPRVYLT